MPHEDHHQPSQPPRPPDLDSKHLPNHSPAVSRPHDLTLDSASLQPDNAARHLPPVESCNNATDLPCPLRGNGGNLAWMSSPSPDDVRQLFDLADRLVPAPPLSDINPTAVTKWVNDATAGAAARRTAIRLARSVERILDEHWQTMMWLDREREVFARREAAQQAKASGKYWRQRDARRRAQQPTHVDVHPEAWKALKEKCRAQGRTIGATVGHLVTNEVRHNAGVGHVPPLEAGTRPGLAPGRRAQRFARLEISKDIWQQFCAIAIKREIALARYVGILVEHAVRLTSSGA